MIDLRDIYTSGESSMTIDEIVDTVLGTKFGYIKGLGYDPKPNTTRATQKRTVLEDSLKKVKQEAANAQHDLQKRLNAAETEIVIADPFGVSPNHPFAHQVGLVHGLLHWNSWRAEGSLGESPSDFCEFQLLFSSDFPAFTLIFTS
uniref:Uncharacterized protein n=1 Tax=Solanum tuberosum TaxID=4113 RepID=M1DV89_SOLTU